MNNVYDLPFIKFILNAPIYHIYCVYGETGHRQRESFYPSYRFIQQDRKVAIDVQNSDKTGTNDYTILVIYGYSDKDIEDALQGQLSDGIFENSRVGHIERV